ncbi:EKC/KEOPS complex subunit [Parastagonospora nodorum]|uniref:EKC/KEOPS complex subunit CGI121 n=1 Tax=Phaeosphaeria nodorum (strain SN15 / ATCC MYA-4574 / FGSC 10173) TaxID=321614 RepID=A0A7U2EP17_PHANO|nr:EKC/KEOPS complex subunit [Parastagonospora nodorum]QRC90385.1 EKC/KEOPS complex subunit [Parastagonospora nodorum SN15]KAH3937939.1 EKC/KEOPS complex subunit [Parastagonospora nodorum]KAH3946592.1 EKC/KEOPS complex subunit [Parastagonospora nodorum]KAH3975011.1 EKC/KEOPS complex subunit [Parastagonospora nodorum]
MAHVRTFTLPHYEAYPVHVALFKDVKNPSYLKSQLLEANPAFDYAFLDAAMILSPTHLLSTTFITIHALCTHRQKTRTPHSELVFRLSPNNNIGESYKKFGISDTTTHLIAVKLPLKSSDAEAKEWLVDGEITNESVSQHLGSVVEGTSVEISEKGEELGQWCDIDKIRKVYKLGDGSAKKGKKGAAVNGDGAEKEGEKKQMEVVILGTIALKGS